MADLRRHIVTFLLISSLATLAGLGWFLFSPVPEAVGATCPWSDGDGGDSDGGANGTYTFNGSTSVVPAATDYDCTSGTTSITTFIIPNGVTVTLQGDDNTGEIAAIDFTNLQIDSGGALRSDAEGCPGVAYTTGEGPNSSTNICSTASGAPGTGSGAQTGGGGGYGGNGGVRYDGGGAGTALYGSSTDPVLFGSAGGGGNGAEVGGAGGGVVRIDVAGTLTHNGTMSANGGVGSNDGTYAGGGGSGGSVFVTAGTLAGTTGTFEAKGGSGLNMPTYDTGGGGGGRVAVKYASATLSLASGTFDVGGGGAFGSATAGTKGTVFTEDTGSNDIRVFHGFTFADIDWSVNSFVFDISATNMYCSSGLGSGATPSITAPFITFRGFLRCLPQIASFNFIASSGDVTFESSSEFEVKGNIAPSIANDLILGAGAKIRSTGGSLTLAPTNDISIGNGAELEATAGTTISSPNAIVIPDNAVVSGSGGLTITTPVGLTVGTGATLSSTGQGDDITIDIPDNNDQIWTNVTVNGGAQGVFDMDAAIDLDLLGTTNVNANVQWLNLTSLDIASTAIVRATGKGCHGLTYSTGTGPNGSNVCSTSTGAPGSSSQTGGGGGHGGRGGNYYGGTSGGGTALYGSATAPVLYGSAGGGGNGAKFGGYGGGAIRINVNGTFTHDGTISADGAVSSNYDGTYGGGGGSGGSVYVTADALAGTTGTFEAKGGSGVNLPSYDTGGGGGGRVAVVVDTSTFSFDASDFDVSGGAAFGTATAGTKGTVFVHKTVANDVEIYHGFTYTDTDWNVNSFTWDASATNQYCDRTLLGAATPSITATSLQFRGTLTCAPTSAITSFNLIASTGDIEIVDSSVFSIKGSVTPTAADDIIIGNSVTFSATSGSMTINPTDSVTIGTSSSITSTGAMSVTTSSTPISVGDGTTISSSGGAFTLSTAGAVSLGANSALGGAGTMLISTTTGLTVGTGADITNSGLNVDTTIDIPDGDDQTWTDVSFAGAPEGDFTMDAIIDLVLTGTSDVNGNVQFLNLTSLNIGSSASISATGKGCHGVGYSTGFGPDVSNVCSTSSGAPGSSSQTGGGGGHGGRGGNYYGGTSGGGTALYGSATAPTRYGSAGGGGNGNQHGGYGGGYVRINVNGTLTNNGVIGANGGLGQNDSGTYAGGGGSGGSVYVTADALAGTTGTFEARGADGRDKSTYDTGGGGGGRIAVVVDTSTFSFDASDFDVSGGAAFGTATAGVNGTVFVHETTANDVSVFHGFTYADTDWNVNSFTIDASTTNQYCDSAIGGAATPSITVPGSFTFRGSLNCTPSIVSFGLVATVGATIFADGSSFTVNGDIDTTQTGDITVGNAATVSATGGDLDLTTAGTLTLTDNSTINASGVLTVDPVNALTIENGASLQSGAGMTIDAPAGLTLEPNVSITNTGLNTDILVTISNNDDQTWNGVTISGAAEGDLLLSAAIDLTLTGSSDVNTNAVMENLTSLTIDAGSSFRADAKGCRGATYNDGYGPDGSNVCSQSTAGAGNGNGGGSGAGGGHGGAGGNSSSGQIGGTTYGSNTDPVLYGSAGGGANGAKIGGYGGGLLKLSVTGTLTLNGTMSANGGVSTTTASTYTAGGGSGGSINLTTGTFAGTTGSLSASGGNGQDSSNDSGGGGGGRIAVLYSTDSSTFLSGLTAAGVAPGGTSFGSAQPGSDGTLYTLSLDSPPNITVIEHSPSNPTTSDPVTLSVTATDNNGIDRIDLYLNGTPPSSGLVHTCLFSAQTPASCQFNVGTLANQQHTFTAIATDTAAQTAQDTDVFSINGQTSASEFTLSRLAAGATNVDFALAFDLSGTESGSLTVVFPAQFTVTAPGTAPDSSGCLSSFGFTATTLTATKTSCSGTVTLGGAKLTNPAGSGVYTVTWSNDSGSGTIVIVDDDQVNVSGNVDPELSFNVGSQASASTCDGTFSGNGGTLPLGSLTTASVASSDASSVPHVCTRVTTNSTGGATVSVRSLNAALASIANPGDAIASSTATLVAGTEGYGMCVGSSGTDTGTDVTTPTGATPVRSAPFNSTCTASDHNVGGLTTSLQSLFTLAGPSQNAFARVYLKAAISPGTPAHDDYTDVLTFIVSAEY